MKKILILLLSISIFSSNVQSQISNIIGGQEIDIIDTPWQVSLKRSDNNSHFCGGTILSDTWILTAAHCVVNLQANQLKVHAGASNQTQLNNGQYIQVVQIIVHPDYNASTFDNDIALLRLSTPLSYNSRVKAIQYANPCNLTPDLVEPNKLATLTGWGRTCGNCPIATILRRVEMPIISNIDANQINSINSSGGSLILVNDNMIAFFRQGAGAAPGDSGGPAVIFKNSQPILIGASSWGYPPKDQFPTIYTNIFNYANWINTLTQIPFDVVDAQILGSNLVCSSANYSVSNLPAGSIVSDWQSSNPSGLIINAQGVATRQNNFNGSITITAIITSPCGSSTVTRNIWVGLPQNPPQFPNIPYYVQLCVGRPSGFTASLIPNASQYIWTVSPSSGLVVNPNANGTNVFLRGDVPGVYTLSLAASNACGSNLTISTIEVEVFAQNHPNCSQSGGCRICDFTLNIYPNPADESLEVSLEEENQVKDISSATNERQSSDVYSETYTIKIVNQYQVVAYQGSHEGKNFQISTRNIPNGLYILQIIGEKGMLTKQILIQH